MTAANERAYRLIRGKIGDGTLKAGARLKEAELVELCDVSRTPIREALRRLESDGLVTITPNSGAIVAKWGEQELKDLFDVRAHIEALAAHYAAERRTDADLQELARFADAMDTLVQRGDHPPDLGEITRLNSAFHRAVLGAARSRALQAAAAQVVEAPLMLRTFRRYDAEQLARSAAQHLEITQAIRVSDAAWASTVMGAHIRAGYRALTTPLALQDEG